MSRRWTVGAFQNTTSEEGIKHLYRTILIQARLLASTMDDPVLFASHRYLARCNLQPVLDHHTQPPRQNSDGVRDVDADFGTSWPASPMEKRWSKARGHRRNLANANLGWEHAVYRAMCLAYGRTGRLSRDQMSDLASPECATSTIVAAILTSQNSMHGAPVKNAAALKGRPPPPYLPALDDPLVKYFGKGMTEGRVRNATKKFHRTYRNKANGRLPLDVVFDGEKVDAETSLWAHLEARARPASECVTTSPSHLPQHRERAQETAPAHHHFAQARSQALLYSSAVVSSPHRRTSMRLQGWTSHPRDYTCARTRRRIYGRLLYDTPILVLPAPTSESPCFSTLVMQAPSQKDPLGIRAKHRAACAYTRANQIAAPRIKLLRSRWAVGASNKGGDLVPPSMTHTADTSLAAWRQPSTWLDSSEIEFLQHNKVI